MIMERQADGTYALAHFSYQAAGHSDLDGSVPAFKSDSVRISFYYAQRWTDISAGMTRMQQAADGWVGARPICTSYLNQAQIHEIDPSAIPRGLVSLAQPMGHFPGVYTPNGERLI